MNTVFAVMSLSLVSFAASAEPLLAGKYLTQRNCIVDVRNNGDTVEVEILSVRCHANQRNIRATYVPDAEHTGVYVSKEKGAYLARTGFASNIYSAYMKLLDDGTLAFAKNAEKLTDKDLQIRLVPIKDPVSIVELNPGSYSMARNHVCSFDIKKVDANLELTVKNLGRCPKKLLRTWVYTPVESGAFVCKGCGETKLYPDTYLRPFSDSVVLHAYTEKAVLYVMPDEVQERSIRLSRARITILDRKSGLL